MQPTGSIPTSMYPSHEAASVGIGQSIADDGTALPEEHDKNANRAPHLKPKRVDEAKSFVEQFGVDRKEYEKSTCPMNLRPPPYGRRLAWDR